MDREQALSLANDAKNLSNQGLQRSPARKISRGT